MHLHTDIVHHAERLGELKRKMTLEQAVSFFKEEVRPEIIPVQPSNLAIIKLKEPFGSYFLVHREPMDCSKRHCTLRFNYRHLDECREALGYSRPFHLVSRDELKSFSLQLPENESRTIYCCTADVGSSLISPKTIYEDAGKLIISQNPHWALPQEMRNGFLPIIIEMP